MSLITTPNSCKEIYNTYLKEIAGVVITRRQVEVIACVIHNRGDKKIASILCISPRTASAHIRDILNKFGYNSREQIIDTIEKSGKLKYIKQYYHHLLIQSYFEQVLRKISTTLSLQNITCVLNYEQADVMAQENLLLQITENLKLAGINVVENNYGASEKKHTMVKEDVKQIDLTIINTTKLVLKIPTDLLNASSKNETNRKVFLLFNKDQETIDAKSAIDVINSYENTVNYVDFTDINRYYFSFLQLIHKIYNTSLFNDVLEHLIQDFKNYYNSIVTADDNNLLCDEQINRKFIIKLLSKYVSNTSGKVIIFIGIIMIIISVFLGIRAMNNTVLTQQLEQPAAIHTEQQIQEIEKKLNYLVDNFSSDNVTQKNKTKNHQMIGEVTKVIESLIQEQNIIQLLSFNGLMDYLYLINAYGHYHMYNNHDGKEAYSKLLHGRHIIINYILKQSKIIDSIDDFDKLRKEDQYSELMIISELVKMYTRIIYAFAKTYTYEGIIKKGEKYFEIAEYFGKKTGLFEGVLSINNGIGLIKNDEIDENIKKQNYTEATNEAKELIQLYEELQNDDKEYVLEYKPNRDNNSIIVPKNNSYNNVLCLERIIKSYNKLFDIANNDLGKQENANIIADKFISLLKELTKLEKSSLGKNTRKVASVYNNLGYTLLKFYQNKIVIDKESKNIINKIITNSEITNQDDLEIIESIFQYANNESRFNDYTKADSYNGLIEIKKIHLIQESIFSKEEKQKLLDKIEQLTQERDKINQKLKRNIKY